MHLCVCAHTCALFGYEQLMKGSAPVLSLCPQEFKTVPGTRIKNQLYDPEFVEKAKAEGKRVLEAHS